MEEGSKAEKEEIVLVEQEQKQQQQSGEEQEEEEEEEEFVALGLANEAEEEASGKAAKPRKPSKEERKRAGRAAPRPRPGAAATSEQPTDPSLMKSYRSAIVMLPPIEAWPPMQAIRRVHDYGYVRWPPHVNMIYPFVPNQQFAAAAQTLREALASFPAFRVRLREFTFFKHSRSWTVWLKPETEPEGALVRLQAELERAFPHCNDLSQISGHGFVPHLSVANDFRKASEVEEKRVEWEKEWKEVAFDVNELYLISRLGANDTPFDVRYAIPLQRASSSPSSPTEEAADASAGSLLPPPSFTPHPIDCDEREAVPSATRVIVFNIPFDVTEDDLIELFGGIGQRLGISVDDVKLIRKPKCSARAKASSTGRAYVELRTAADQINLLANVGEIVLGDRTLALRPAQA